MTNLEPSADEYDVVVAGGGLAGFAAALQAADAGLRVLVVEPTGTLGREIVRGRVMFADLVALAIRSRAARLILDGLRDGSAWFDGALDPTYAALVLDKILGEAGVDVLFHVWPVAALHHDGGIDGIQVASQSGYLSVEAPYVVDTSRRARIAGQLVQKAVLTEQRLSRRFLFAADEAPWPHSPSTYDLGVRGEARLSAEVRPTYHPGEWRISIDYALAGTSARPGPLRADDLGDLLLDLSPEAPLRLIHTAEEPIEIPAFRLPTGGSPVAGLTWAGLWSAPEPVALQDHPIAEALLDQGRRAVADVLS
ncbi:FAD-dependent oxidoreductase [Kribbella sp. NPDC048928]|uniref:FAD-dependent oxidoreductase n=1 Tax=Kribbella sp. NPDC048928 TaxID=3364111 RepID=UPI003715A8D7